MNTTRTLDDTLVSSIQRAPCRPLAKLALADLLEERGNGLEARALRWCAENCKWPQRRGYVREYRYIPDRCQEPTGYLWQWWHHGLGKSRRRTCEFWVAAWAIVTDEISRCWPANRTWGHSTWFTALTALGMALRQLEEESNANCEGEDGTFSPVDRSL